MNTPTSPCYVFMRLHDMWELSAGAHSDWVGVAIAPSFSEIDNTAVHRAFNRLMPHNWHDRFTPSRCGWQADRAARQGEDCKPVLIYDFAFLAEKAVGQLTYTQATDALNNLKGIFWQDQAWQQEGNEAFTYVTSLPDEPQMYKDGAAFLEQQRAERDRLPELEPSLLKYVFHPDWLAEKKLREQPVKASAQSVEAAVQPTVAQSHRRRITSSRLDPAATLRLLKRLRAKEANPSEPVC